MDERKSNISCDLCHMYRPHQMTNASHEIKMLIWQSLREHNYFEHQFCQTVELFCLCKSILREDTEQEREWHKDRLREKRVLKSQSEVKWNRWRRRDGEEKRRREVMGSGAVPGFYWRLGLALARRDKREIIIRPAEAWQPFLGSVERQTVHYVKDWPCHRWRHLLTDSGIWSFTWQ